jgi:hypothetical protein
VKTFLLPASGNNNEDDNVLALHWEGTSKALRLDAIATDAAFKFLSNRLLKRRLHVAYPFQCFPLMQSSSCIQPR